MQANVITATELAKMEFDESMLWHIEDLLPANSISVLTGPSDCGKSSFAAHLALEVASGSDYFLNYKINSSNRRVLYCSSEDSELSTAGRLKRQMKGMTLHNCDNLKFVFGSDEIEATLGNLEDINPGLIILDTLSDRYNGNPNDWSKVREWLRGLRSVATNQNCSILGIHHNVKNSEKTAPDKNKVNGSQAIEAVVRCVFELRMGKGLSCERDLTILKNNYLAPEKKNQPKILEFASITSLFKLLNKGAEDVSKNQYDVKKWMKRYAKENPDSTLSIDKTIAKLVERYPDDKIPGKTWFAYRLKDTQIVQSVVETITPLHEL